MTAAAAIIGALLRACRAEPLLAASLLYLYFPLALFLVGWLKPVLGLPLAAIVLVGAVCTLRDAAKLPTLEPGRRRDPRWFEYALAVIVALLWVSVSGAGGYGPQEADYSKHNALLRDLILYPWPVAYYPLRDGDPTVFMVYYFAFYLPPALIGKFFGWFLANQAYFVWTFGGALLALLWFGRLVGHLVLAVPLFVLFSGMDFLTGVVRDRGFSDPRHLSISEWALLGIWQYPSNTNLLVWVPQHALGGWIITAVLLSLALRGGAARSALFLLSASPLWSTIVTLGLVPYVALVAWNEPTRRLVSVQNLVAGSLLFLTSALMLVARNTDIRHGFVWSFVDLREVWPILLAFYVFEFGLYVALCWPFVRSGPAGERRWLIVSATVLLVLPWFVFGPWNDLVMRASIPALFVIAVFAGRLLLAPLQQRWLIGRWILALLLAIGSLAPLSLLTDRLRRQAIRIPPLSGVRSATHLDIRNQYVGSAEAAFFRYLARPTEAGWSAHPVIKTIAEARATSDGERSVVAFVPPISVRDLDNYRYWAARDRVSVQLVNDPWPTADPAIVVSRTAAPGLTADSEDEFAATLRDPSSPWSRLRNVTYSEFARVRLPDGSESVVYVRRAPGPH